MPELMTRANINQFLIEYIGFSDEEVAVMPSYLTRDLIEDQHETFTEYFEESL